MATFKKFKTTYDTNDCPVATVQLDNFNANSIIKSIKYDNMIMENSTSYGTIQKLDPIGSGEPAYTGDFRMTHYLPNEFNSIDYLFTEQVNEKNEPLFYEYQLKFDVYGLSDKDLIQVYKNNVEMVPESKYKIEFSDYTLFDNYTSIDDPDYTRYGSKVEWTTFNNLVIVHRARILLPIEFSDDNNFYTVRYNKYYLNIQNPTHLELLELEDLYNQDSFLSKYDSATNSEIIEITDPTINKANINILYASKDPHKRIFSDDIVSVVTDGTVSDATSSWNLKVNNGAFIRSHSIFNTETSYYNYEYAGEDQYRYQVQSYLKPQNKGWNIVQVEESPIYITDYTYPDYNIPLFPNITDSNTLPLGSIGFNIDNELLNNLSIASIDRYKGYIMFNTNIMAMSDVSLFVYVDFDYSMFIRNLELNPRIAAKYGISSNSETSFKDLGIAVRKIDEQIPESQKREYYHPYFFDFNDPTKFYLGEVISNTNDTLIVDDSLSWNPYTSESNPSGQFIPIAQLSLNRLALDAITLTDARRINGGLSKDYLPNLDNNQNNSYADIGYVDGELLPYEGLKIVHLPREVYDGLVTRWKNSNLFNQELYTDVTQYEVENFKTAAESGYYENLLEGKATNKEDQYRNPFTKMEQEWAEHEASYYLDKLVKKYISAGTNYILLDENFEQIKLRLEI